MLKRLYKVFDSLKFQEFMSTSLIILAAGFVILLAVILPSSQLEETLREFAQIVSVISIGIGTIAITLAKEGEFKENATRAVVFTLLIALVAYLLSYINFVLLQRMYFALSGLYLIYLLGVVSENIYSTSKNDGKKANSAITAKSKKKKKRRKR